MTPFEEVKQITDAIRADQENPPTRDDLLKIAQTFALLAIGQAIEELAQTQ
jgi:hypothetical protein